MIGIYKITNKLNNKSYIGQSIHCGKRLDEHCKGKQLIDDIIKIEGIENFTFEILKEVEKENLSYWEDYYIIKYNTMFPNGYNKKWNCSEDIRNKIKERIDSSIEENNDDNTILLCIEEDFLKKIKYCDNLYAWLLLNSYYNQKEHNYYIYKNNINYSKIAQELCKSRQTISKRVNELLQENFIKEDLYNGKKCYKIPCSNNCEKLDKNVVKQLLQLSSEKQKEEIIKTYAYLLSKKRITQSEGQRAFYCSAREILAAFGDSTTHTENYDRMRCILTILQGAGIIKFRTIMPKQLENGQWRGQQLEVYEVNKRASEEWLGINEENKENKGEIKE